MKRISFFSQVSWLFSGQFLSILLGLLGAIVISRGLGVEGRGYLTMALSFSAMLITFSGFGSGDSIPKALAGNKYKNKNILFTLILLFCARIFLIFILASFILIYYQDLFFKGVPIDYLILALITVIPIGLISYFVPYVFGLGETKHYSGFLLFYTCSVIIIFLFYVFNSSISVKEVLYIEIFWGFFVASMSFLYLLNKVKLSSPRFDFSFLREAFSYGSGIYVSDILNFFNTRIIFLFINSSVGIAAVGIYTMALVVADKMFLIADSVGSILFLRAAQSESKDNIEFTGFVLRLVFLVLSCIAIMLGLFSEIIFTLLFGEEFLESAYVVKVLLLAFVFYGCWRILWSTLNGLGQSWVSALINTLSTVVNFLFILILMPKFGLMGVALSFVFASFSALILGIYQINKISKQKSLYDIILYRKTDFLFLFNALSTALNFFKK